MGADLVFPGSDPIRAASDTDLHRADAAPQQRQRSTEAALSLLRGRSAKIRWVWECGKVEQESVKGGSRSLILAEANLFCKASLGHDALRGVHGQKRCVDLREKLNTIDLQFAYMAILIRSILSHTKNKRCSYLCLR